MIFNDRLRASLLLAEINFVAVTLTSKVPLLNIVQLGRSTADRHAASRKKGGITTDPVLP
jgi:hypothetical protein